MARLRGERRWLLTVLVLAVVAGTAGLGRAAGRRTVSRRRGGDDGAVIPLRGDPTAAVGGPASVTNEVLQSLLALPSDQREALPKGLVERVLAAGRSETTGRDAAATATSLAGGAAAPAVPASMAAAAPSAESGMAGLVEILQGIPPNQRDEMLSEAMSTLKSEGVDPLAPIGTASERLEGLQYLMGQHGLRPAAPGAPAPPVKPMLSTLLGGIQAFVTILVLSKILPMVLNPGLILQFVDPKIMVANPPILPATFREASPDKPEYFHPFGQWGDYGYEPMGMKGYGCASGSCAPWWWSWTHKNKQFAPFSKSAPIMD